MKSFFDIFLKFYRHRYTRFGFAATIYILWVIWLGNYWFLLGLPIIFDIYISKKVNWSPWKKRGVKNHWLIEWFDAIIFAVVAVAIINIFLFQNYKIPTGSMEKTLLIGDHLYVSKVAYGPKIPNTPLSFPFAQHTLPFTKSTPSYLKWIQLPYQRLAGFGKVKRNDIVVFNFPEGDTVVVEMQAQSYYSIVRGFAEEMENRDRYNNQTILNKETYYQKARAYVWANYEVVVRPSDRMDPYIKRCVAVAGDTLSIKNGYVYINGQIENKYPGMQFRYLIQTNGSAINTKILEKMNISKQDILSQGNNYLIPLTSENADRIKSFSNILFMERNIKDSGQYSSVIFPHDEQYPWNEDNWGPFVIPQKGDSVLLTSKNICFYERIIDCYEYNDFLKRGDEFIINGKAQKYYVFKQDYYFMMGDNRHDSADSRFWGLVPEEAVMGKPIFIWLSLNRDKTFPFNITWDRMFTSIK